MEVALARVDDLDGDVEGRGAQDERVVLEEFTRRRHIRDDYSQVGGTTAEDACNEGGGSSGSTSASAWSHDARGQPVHLCGQLMLGVNQRIYVVT